MCFMCFSITACATGIRLQGFHVSTNGSLNSCMFAWSRQTALLSSGLVAKLPKRIHRFQKADDLNPALPGTFWLAGASLCRIRIINSSLTWQLHPALRYVYCCPVAEMGC